MSSEISYNKLLELLLEIYKKHNAIWQWYTKIFTDPNLNPVDVDIGVELPDDNSVIGFLEFDNYTTTLLKELKKEREGSPEMEKKIEEITQLKWRMISAFSANSREEDPMLYVRVIRALFHLYPCNEDNGDDTYKRCDHSVYMGFNITPRVLKQISELDEEHFREIITLCGGDPDNLVIYDGYQFIDILRSLDLRIDFEKHSYPVMDKAFFEFFIWLFNHTEITVDETLPWMRWMKSKHPEDRRMMSRILKVIGLPVKSKEMEYDFEVVTFA